ncbi:MAG: PIN domain-containing protein [Bacillus subtilis]|nr:PIN domain-containing protein [Bacillus subtilis]
MNFFLDTNILFDDPFLKGNYNRQLTEIVRMSLKLDKEYLKKTGYQSEFLDEEYKIYISSVVYEESKNKYIEKIEKIFNQLKDFNTSIEKYMDSDKIAESPFTKNQCIQRFDEYYDSLQQDGIVEILEPYNNITKDLIDRAVHKRGPFFNNNKNEFRDAVIWLTYSSFAEKNELKNCYLITNNVNDFADLENKNKVPLVLHSELIKDSNKFIVYKSIKELVTSDGEFKKRLQMTNEIAHHLNESLEDIVLLTKLRALKDNLDDHKALKLLREKSDLQETIFHKIVHRIINDQLDREREPIDPLKRYIIPPEYGGFAEPHTPNMTVNIIDLTIDDKEIVENSILISAEIKVPFDIALYNDRYERSTMFQVEFIVPLSFLVNLDQKISKLECDTPYHNQPAVERSTSHF